MRMRSQKMKLNKLIRMEMVLEIMQIQNQMPLDTDNDGFQTELDTTIPMIVQ